MKLHKLGIRPKISMRYESLDAIKTAVRQGAGAGILHYDTLREEVRRKEFVVLKLAGIDMTYKSHIVYAKKKTLSVVAKEFLALLRIEAKRDQLSESPRLASKLPASGWPTAPWRR